MRQFKILIGGVALATLLLSGCVPPPSPSSSAPTAPSPLTQGNVQISLEKGKTTQNQVLQAFGPPNVSSINADGEAVWTYQRMAVASAAQTGADFFTIILASNIGSSSSFSNSQRTMTLIITFDEGVLVDYRSLSTSF